MSAGQFEKPGENKTLAMKWLSRSRKLSWTLSFVCNFDINRWSDVGTEKILYVKFEEHRKKGDWCRILKSHSWPKGGVQQIDYPLTGPKFVYMFWDIDKAVRLVDKFCSLLMICHTYFHKHEKNLQNTKYWLLLLWKENTHLLKVYNLLSSLR